LITTSEVIGRNLILAPQANLMKTIFTPLLLILLSISAQSQQTQTISIKLYGKTSDYRDRKVIYYTLNDEPFSTKKTITLRKDKSYVFDLSKTVYKNATTGSLVFTFDSVSNPSDEYACVQKISLDGLYAHAKQTGKKALDLRTDLDMSYNCTSTVYYGAEGDEEKFVGRYTVTSGDTTFSIKLDKGLYHYSSTYSPASKYLTSKETGSWNYNAEKQTLQLNTWYRFDSSIGIMISENRHRVFKVVSSPAGLQFISEDGSKLVKL
jgi:hypothetical protein